MKNIYLSILTLLLAVNHSFSQANLLNAKSLRILMLQQLLIQIRSLSRILKLKIAIYFGQRLYMNLLILMKNLTFIISCEWWPVLCHWKSLWKIIRENVENGNIDEVFDVRNDNFLKQINYRIDQIKDFYGSKFTPGDSRPQT